MTHFYGAVGTPDVGHHQWQPHSRRRLVKGDGRFNRAARLFLHEIRWRQQPSEYGLRVIAGVLTFLVHVFMLALLVLVQPSGFAPSQGGKTEVASIQVRLISKPKPPPPPPPIKLPRRHVKKAVRRRVPAVVKRAPVAAMPPVRQVATAQPKIKLTTVKPKIATSSTPPQPVQQAAASPPVPAQAPQVELSPVPPKVVLEKSRMAVAPPELASVQVAPAKVPSSGLQPVPTQHVAPVVKLGNPKVQVQTGEVQGAPVLSARVEASAPTIPVSKTATPVEHVAVAPAAAPSVHAPTVTLHALSAPAAALAPVPQAPQTVKVSPALNLPIAQVPEPQAPAVQVPAVHVQATPSTTPTAPAPANRPAPATSASTAHVPPTGTTKSWAPANDQFKPLSGKHTASVARAGTHAGHRQGSVQLLPRGNSDVMTRNSDHLGYKSTIFNQYWAPANEDILDAFLQRLIDKLTVTHTFEVAPGIRVKCMLSPMMVFFACGGGSDELRPPPSNDNDRRLNMVPVPLVPGLNTSTPARSSTVPPVQLNNNVKCEVARVAGSPPPPGCPGAPVKPSQSDQWYPHGGGG